MKPQNIVGQAKTPDGEDLVLYERDGAYQIRVDGMELMSSRAHGSEDALAELTREAIGKVAAPKVLIGGLGMGFTLRSALKCFPRGATLVVAEVFPEVVEWNRGPLAHLAGRPLEDRRVELRRTDVARLFGGKETFDGILLDVDNGPTGFTLESNAGLYTVPGLKRIRRSLTAKGVLSVWSADDDTGFEKQLRRARFKVRRERIAARGRGGGPRHTIYLARPLR